MLLALVKHQISQFHFRFTGNESWMFYSDHLEAMLIPSWSDVDNIERPSHFRKKTMIAVFLNGIGKSLIGLPLDGKKMDSMYLTQNIIDPLVALCYHTQHKSCSGTNGSLRLLNDASSGL
jgi:hypothetical protein